MSTKPESIETAIDRAITSPDSEELPTVEETVGIIQEETLPIAAPSFKRAWLRGYKRDSVDGWTLSSRSQIETMTETISSHEHAIRMLQNKLYAAESELRFWHDRESYIDSQLEAARAQADVIVSDARNSADNLTKRTQQNALQIIERSFGEARKMLDEARDNAEKTMVAANSRLDNADDRMQRVLHARYEMLRTMRHTIGKLESDLPGETEKSRPVTVASSKSDGILSLRGVVQQQQLPATVTPLHA